MRRYSIFTCLLLSILMASPKLCVSQLYKRDIHEIYQRKDKRTWGEKFDDWLKTDQSIWEKFSKRFKGKAFNKSYALVIGLSNYSGGWGTLESPYYDALRVRNYLINEAEFDYVVTLTNREATKEVIGKYMEETFPEMIEEKDKFLFYYSGHGTQKKLPSGNPRGYLPMLVSEKESWSDMISMDEIEGWVKGISAKHQLFVLDCCFSGLAGIQAAGSPEKLYLEDLSQPGHYLITAGAENQNSYGSVKEWGGSLFTYTFLEGLSGEADAGRNQIPKDGVIHFEELYDYIGQQIKTTLAGKNPNINQSPQKSILGEGKGKFFFITAEKWREGFRSRAGTKGSDSNRRGEVKGPESNGIKTKVKVLVQTRGMAFSASLALPGLGQHIQGRHIWGWTYTSLTAGMIGAVLWSGNRYSQKLDKYDEVLNRLKETAPQQENLTPELRNLLREQEDAFNEAKFARKLAVATQIVLGAVWGINTLDAAVTKPKQQKRQVALEGQPTIDGGRVIVHVQF
ncbi:caspase family protein [Candidatus Poribacteria bacterium]|nr:caspase family protein [Candidatus Poribacteria bacterium]